MITFLLSNAWRSACFALLLTCGWLYLQAASYRVDAERSRADLAHKAAALSEARLKAVQAAREAEQRQVQMLAVIEAQHQRELIDAQSKKADVESSLRADVLRLRKQWQGCEARVPATSTNPTQHDENAELRRAGAADLVRIGAECDARIRALQQAMSAR